MDDTYVQFPSNMIPCQTILNTTSSSNTAALMLWLNENQNQNVPY